MGPFPHDAPPATISAANPAGTDGFEFVEFAHPEPEKLADLFQRMGYAPVARHKTKNITRLSPGRHQLHAERRARLVRRPLRRRARALRAVDGLARRARRARLRPRREARRRALHRRRQDARRAGHQGHRRLADLFRRQVRRAWARPTTREFDWLGARDPKPEGVGFYYLDHLTHNVYRGNMDKWFGFYAQAVQLPQIRFFDIEGKLTGLHSRALTSPCGRIRIPINESADDHSQIEEYLKSYKGEGIQHIAVGQRDALRRRRRAGRQRRALHAGPARDLLRAELRARAGPHRADRRACSGTAS